MNLCVRVSESFNLCIGVVGSGNIGDSGMYMILGSGWDVFLSGAESMLLNSAHV